MANFEMYDDLIIGRGIAGKCAAWTHDSRRRTVIVERGLLGGACPNVACLPSKNMIWSAGVISLARRAMEFWAQNRLFERRHGGCSKAKPHDGQRIARDTRQLSIV